jgi:mono/diheme cytochrome c family protein
MAGLILGCGTNAGDLAGQYAEAVLQTAVDQWLTSLANELNGTPIEPDVDDSTPGDGDTGDGGTEEPGGDTVRGGELYTANGCGGCHCPDASGGCGLGAPAIIGASVEAITSILDPASGHPTQPELTETDVADLAAYLATLIPG